jgi:hypothetical protein
MANLPSRSLKSVWYLFLLAVLASGAAFYGLDSALTRLKASEQLSLFMAADGFEEEKIVSSIQKAKPASVVAMDEHFAIPSSATYSTLYSAYGPGVADVMLLPENSLAAAAPKLAPLKDSVLSPYFGTGLTYWSIEEVNYGLLAHQHGASSQGLVTYSASEDYYLCFSASSVQIGALNGTSDDAAFKVGSVLVGL